MSDVPKIFITYSWDNEQHKEWVRKFSDRLLSDGVDVTVDQYDVSSGDRLPQFMEQSITAADFVLIICTPLYKQKADRRMGGAGYEGHIISDELFQKHNERKFIPVIRKGDHLTAMPTFCAGKFAIDLSESPFLNLSTVNYWKQFLERNENLLLEKSQPLLATSIVLVMKTAPFAL